MRHGNQYRTRSFQPTYNWSFPLPRTHTGMLLGNGLMGAMVWGEELLCITIGRVDLWDHRGGLQWTEKQSYAAIRDCLERGDQQGLRKLFEETDRPPGHPARPSIVPVGRIEIDFGSNCSILSGELNLKMSSIVLSVSRGKREHRVRIVLDMTKPVLAVTMPAALRANVSRVPAWEYVGDHLTSIGFSEPELFDDDASSTHGWTQALPDDPAFGLSYRFDGRQLVLATGRGESPAAARDAAEALLGESPKDIQDRSRIWLNAFWKDAAYVDIPNQELKFLYDYGMYKFAGLTHPDGVAATLQGPWVEEYQMPPWSNDYHFNINVQMCYWPAFHGNRLEHLRPLFDLIHSWEPILRRNAHHFLGIDDGYMLPHAVDDRCTCMGGFWTGTIDHGCTAWVAQMMYRYYAYTLDRNFLAERAFPFMKGTMRVYEEMLERDGESFVLPVSVSPEYRGASMDAWGANASFQLACIHRLCEDLLAAARILGETPSPIWSEIADNCPRYSAFERNGKTEMGLWDGTPLEESHRHHSHLAAITPFDTLDWEDEETRAVIEQSICQWIAKGPGMWSGWCVPWASMIHSRLGNADAAELWLDIWQRVFTNEGHGTLHDVDVAGFSLMGKGAVSKQTARPEIMQMDAGMSAVAAIQEMLVHERRGIVYLFKGAPSQWRICSFAGMRVAGGFLLSAARGPDRVGSVTIESPHGGQIRLANPWGGTAMLIHADGRTQKLVGEILVVDTLPGDKLKLRRTP